MKTLTEFSGFVLREALTKKAAWLQEGKAEEEVQTALNEFLKLDETKVAFYKNAIDMTQSRLERVKRVVVAVKATETEKVPETFVERDAHFYLLEYFPSQDAAGTKGLSMSTGRGGRGGDSRGRDGGGRGRDSGRGRDGGGRDGGGGGGGRPARDDRSSRNDAPRSDRPVLEFKEKAPGTFTPRDPSRDKPAAPRTPRPPRAPRDAPSGPKGAGELRLVFKGQSATLLPPNA